MACEEALGVVFNYDVDELIGCVRADVNDDDDDLLRVD